MHSGHIYFCILVRNWILRYYWDITGTVSYTHLYRSGQRRLEEVMYGTEIPGLFMIFAGPSVPNPTEILEKKYFQAVSYTHLRGRQ